jgi:AhpD family alkylhydroperoxidase
VYADPKLAYQKGSFAVSLLEKQQKERSRRRQRFVIYGGYAIALFGFISAVVWNLVVPQVSPGAKAVINGFAVPTLVAGAFAAGALMLDISLRLSEFQDGIDASTAAQEALALQVNHLAGQLQTGVECHFVGDDEDAVRYVSEQYGLQSLHCVRDTHVRTEEPYKKYSSATYEFMQHGLAAFLSRNNTNMIMIAGQRVDNDYIHHVLSAAHGREERVECYRLNSPAPVINFLILEHQKGIPDELLFGWGRHVGKRESVFRSADPRLVEEFRTFYEILRQPDISAKVTLESLLTVSGAAADEVSVGEGRWQQEEYYKFLRAIEREGEGEEYERRGDLRILTGSLIDLQGLGLVLADLFKKRVRVKLLMMDPGNDALLDARYSRRKDNRTVQKVKAEFAEQLVDLTMAGSPLVPNEKELLEVRVSGLMPCGFVAHTADAALMGIMPAHWSYLVSPMIHVPRETHLWSVLDEDWRTRWNSGAPLTALAKGAAASSNL